MRSSPRAGSFCVKSAVYKLPNALRMSVGSEEANRLVVAALKEFLGKALMPRHRIRRDFNVSRKRRYTIGSR